MRSEGGFSLIELVFVLAMLALVLGTLMGPLVTSQQVQQRDANYATAQQEASSGLESMVAQIRQAWDMIAPDPNYVQMDVTLGSTQQLVEYDCSVPQPGSSNRQCVRVYAAIGGTLPTPTANCTGTFPSGTGCSVVVTNLTNGTGSDPVFSWAPNPTSPYYMTATVDVPSSDGQAYLGLRHEIVFSDGTLMRNLDVGN